MVAKIRVHELAKELGLTNKEAVDLCISLGIGIKTHSSSIEEAQGDRVRRKAEREGMIRDQQPEEPVKPKKGAGKGAPVAPPPEATVVEAPVPVATVAAAPVEAPPVVAPPAVVAVEVPVAAAPVP